MRIWQVLMLPEGSGFRTPTPGTDVPPASPIEAAVLPERSCCPCDTRTDVRPLQHVEAAAVAKVLLAAHCHPHSVRLASRTKPPVARMLLVSLRHPAPASRPVGSYRSPVLPEGPGDALPIRARRATDFTVWSRRCCRKRLLAAHRPRSDLPIDDATAGTQHSGIEPSGQGARRNWIRHSGRGICSGYSSMRDPNNVAESASEYNTGNGCVSRGGTNVLQ